MSEPLSKIKILWDSEDSTFVVLDHETRRYMTVKISSPKEIIERGNERNYKSTLKNSFMLFRNDVIDTWNIAKEAKKFRKYPASFKNISLLWNNLPKDVIDIYDQTYIDYKKLIPRFGEFVSYAPHEESTAIDIVETGVVNTEEFINDGENLIVQPEYIPSDNINLATTTNNNSAEENEFFPAENFSNLVVNNNVAEENEYFLINSSEDFSNIDYMTAQLSDFINPMDSLATSSMQYIGMQYNSYDINNEMGLLNEHANDDNDDTGEFTTY